MQGRLSRSLAIIIPPFFGLAAVGYSGYKLAVGPFTHRLSSIDVGIFTIPFRQDAIHFVLLLIIGIFLIYYTTNRDYSSVLPDKLDFDVYFDLPGIQRLLEQAESHDFAGIVIPSEWQDRSAAFHTKLSKDIKQKMGIDIDIRQVENISARGITTFVVEKEDRGFQRYLICEVDGYLTFDMPLRGSFTAMRSFFVLNNSARDRFAVSIKAMLFEHKFVISPLLRQTYISSPGLEVVIENLVAITWVRFFPYVDIGDTLYLAKDGTNYVPIGYCSYRQ